MVSFVIAFSVACTAFFSSCARAAAADGGVLYIATSAYGTASSAPVRIVVVERVRGSVGAASVRCETSNGTAIAGKQYTAVNTTLTWANGDEGARFCNVPISTSDSNKAQSTFSVTISAATGATLTSPTQATITISGNLSGGDVAVSAPTYGVGQGAGRVNVVVNRIGGSSGAASVNYATANKTAIAGTDYTASSGVLNWASGDASSRTVSIPVSNAKAFSGAKSFAFAIAGNNNVELGLTNSAIITISGDAASTAAATGEVTLTWVKPTTDTNGEPLTNLAGYKIFYGTNSLDLTSVIEVSSAAAVEYEISGLSTGTWYFAISAYSTTDAQSTLTPTVYKTI